MHWHQPFSYINKVVSLADGIVLCSQDLQAFPSFHAVSVCQQVGYDKRTAANEDDVILRCVLSGSKISRGNIYES